jgi:hypothetical protein
MTINVIKCLNLKYCNEKCHQIMQQDLVFIKLEAQYKNFVQHFFTNQLLKLHLWLFPCLLLSRM